MVQASRNSFGPESGPLAVGSRVELRRGFGSLGMPVEVFYRLEILARSW